MKKQVNLRTALRRNPNQLFSNIDGEIVMLSIENGEYYSLDSIGSCIWNLLDKPLTFRQIVNNLLEEYEVNEETCINDTQPFLEEFLSKGLIEIVNE